MDKPGAEIKGLDCAGLSVSADSKLILDNLDFQAPGGSRTVIVGPSGAGKTTLLRSICGLESLDRGRIEVGGRRIDPLPPHRRKCAVVFQEPRLLRHLDLLDNVSLGLRANGVSRKERRLRARDLVDEVGLSDRAEARIQGLSGGEQQRVALARALCAEPDLLLLDEPLSAVDPNRRELLMKLILSLQRTRRVTMVSVTHDRVEAAEMGESIALLLEGRIQQYGRPEELFEQPGTEAAARFFGMNLLRIEEGMFAIRPEAVAIDREGSMEMTVMEAAYLGTHVRLRLESGAATLDAEVGVADAPPCGATVKVSLPDSRLWRIGGA